MADLDLDTIRARHARAPHRGPHLDGGKEAHYHRGVLLAEVDRLTGENARLREALIEVAGSIPRWSSQPGIGLLIGSGTVWFETTSSADATLRGLGFGEVRSDG